MTPLTQWAARWNIPAAALAELTAAICPPDTGSAAGGSEAGVQQAVRLEAARRGALMWRNNSGATQDESGRVIRFGLGNDSAAVNKVFKSSDLIGITPVTCPCGNRYGIFTAYEVKRKGWHLTPGDQRGQAQLAFLQRVVALGGIGKFITDPSQI